MTWWQSVLLLVGIFGVGGAVAYFIGDLIAELWPWIIGTLLVIGYALSAMGLLR